MSIACRWVRDYCRTGSPVRQAVMYSLAAHMNDDGKIFPSLKTIAEESQCSRSAVIDALKYLEKEGFLIVDRGERNERGVYPVNYYTIPDCMTWLRGGHKKVSEDAIKLAEGSPPELPPQSARTTRVVRETDHGSTPAVPKEGREDTNRRIIYNNTPSLTLPQDTADGAAWEAPPPPPQRSGSGVSNVVEMARPEPIKRTAGDAARQVTAASESTANWIKVWRLSDEINFNAWCQWMEANNYLQVQSAYTRGFVFVPTAKVEEGTERFIRKFPLANPSQMSNTSLSAE